MVDSISYTVIVDEKTGLNRFWGIICDDGSFGGSLLLDPSISDPAKQDETIPTDSIGSYCCNSLVPYKQSSITNFYIEFHLLRHVFTHSSIKL